MSEQQQRGNVALFHEGEFGPELDMRGLSKDWIEGDVIAIRDQVSSARQQAA